MEAIAAAHAIRSACPRTAVVVPSQYADESYAFELFRDGTAGLAYLLKYRIGEVGRPRSTPISLPKSDIGSAAVIKERCH
jgi:hypothetical protein